VRKDRPTLELESELESLDLASSAPKVLLELVKESVMLEHLDNSTLTNSLVALLLAPPPPNK
jgi:hypothetical protein